MGQLRTKDDTVRFAVIAEGGAVILKALARQARLSSWDWVITSGTDSHEAGRHPLGEAYDISVDNFPNAQAVILGRAALAQELGMAFSVLYEVSHRPSDASLAQIAYVNPDATGPHFHIQVRKHTTYPALPEGTQLA